MWLSGLKTSQGQGQKGKRVKVFFEFKTKMLKMLKLKVKITQNIGKYQKKKVFSKVKGKNILAK